ncbi:MAG: recombinase family protein, partial [Planctomycetes bacterium]|nr:recombinase family protein [Planctomycetota bacterium]
MQVGYIRVSSAGDRQNTELQRDALLAAGVDERHLYEDRASGARDDRPGLKECLAFLRPGDVLVVWKLDRLGRSLAHLIKIIQQLKERGVGFRSLTEAIDTTTSMGEFTFNLFGS